MKITTILLFVCCLQVSARVSSQGITLNVNNAPLNKVFQEIRKQAGYTFIYTETILKESKKVSMDVKNSTLQEVLSICFEPQPFTYKIINHTVVVQPKEKAEVNTNEIIALPPPPVEIHGTVVNQQGELLQNVSVVIAGTKIGTTTNSDGQFTLAAPDDKNIILEISSVGYQTKTVPVGEKREVNIVLETNITGLSDVVVVGYGTQKKSDLTGSLSQVKTKDLTSYPTTNVVQALSGRATGVQIIQNNGSPGSPISVRIRGTNSIQGSNEPLYVVDGFPISGNPDMLNNADIESIDILKDASATAIYGSRGANGVVLITTKKGRKGITKINYEGSFSIQKIRKTLNLMTPIEYGEFYNEQATNDGVPLYFSEDQLNALKKMGKGTDWQNLVMQKAPMQSHTLNVNGGNAKTRFSISGSMLKQKGIVINSYYNRYALRANLNHDISKKFRLEYYINLNRTDNSTKGGGQGGSGRGNSLYSGIISVPPSLAPYNDDGSYLIPILSYPFISNAMINPLNYIYAQSDINKENEVLSNVAISFKPIPELTLKVSGGIQNSDSRGDFYTNHKFVNSNGSASVSTAQYTSLLNENTITYTKSFGKHDLSILGGFTYQNFITQNLGASGSGFVSDIQETNDLGAASVNNPASSGYSKSVLMSYLGRVNYGFNGKYLFTASLRTDGSSKYGEGDKWGYFPSGALAWRISKEDFMKNISFISDLKIRASFGATGSQAISPYATLNQLVSGKTVFDNTLFTTYAPGTRLPNNLKWETTLQSDFGLDASILNNRISFTVDYYIKNTKNLLNNVQLPASLGYTYTIQNVGEMQNKGLELGINADLFTPVSSFQWNLAGNISFNHNKIVKLYGGQDIYGTSYYTGAVGDFVNLLREGQPVGIFYGYVENGYNEKGDIIYKDFNEDGKITSADKTYIGNPNPKYIYGFNSVMSWKGFELSAFFQGSEGNDIFNFSATQSVDLNQGMNLLEDQFLHHWKPNDPNNNNAKYPAATRSLSVAVSNRFVENGSYLRLKNIQLTYNINMEGFKINWLKSGQIYVSGQNLITWTKYSWYDPEVSNHIGDNSINLGIDQYGYPTTKSVTEGLRIGM